MSMNEALNELELTKMELSKLQSELESVKKENEELKQKEFINSLKHSSNRHGW